MPMVSRVNVRFTPKRTLVGVRSASCSLYSRKRTLRGDAWMSVLGHKQTYAVRQTGPLFDHLVAAVEDRERDRQTERLGGLEIDGQFDFRGLLNRQLGWFFAF
jgi:hypothetical protein